MYYFRLAFLISLSLCTGCASQNKSGAKCSRILSIVFILICYSIHAQTITVSGRVTSAANDSPIPGVKILEKGTQNETVSDTAGRYTLNVGSDATLVFSFIGFQTREIKVEGLTNIDVALKADVIRDWQVINTGYGYMTINTMSGVAVELETSDFNRGNIYDPAQLGQGKVAGLSIYNRGWDPHSEAVLRIRGLSTFDTEAMPLIVIDGVPMATLHNLDPQDIESINVLKDGAASAIYGMRGSQGVIIITTKRGSPARGLDVTLQSETAAAVLAKKQPLMTASEHIAAGANDLGASTDWQDEITRTGISTNHHLAISAASNTSSFRVATHVRHVEGILLHSGFDQMNTRANLRHQALDDRLRFDINLSVTNRQSNFSFPQAFRYANLFSPSAPVFFPNGEYYQAILFDNYNPVALLEQNVNLGRRRNINYGGKIDFDILENLTATVNLAQQFESNLNGKYYSRNSLFVGQARGGLAERYTDDRSFTLAEGYLSYDNRGEKADLNLVAGFSYQEDQSESFEAELGNFPNDELGYNAIGYSADVLSGLPNLIDVFSTSSPVNTIQAAFLRATLSLQEAVTFNFSLRRESSNKLGANSQSGIFPAIGANLNLLYYLQNLNMSQFNVRLGYGVTGSIPTQYGLANDQYAYTLSGGGTVSKVRDGNPDLRWEQKKEINLGFDFGVNRLSGSLDFYQRTISDLILERIVDPLVYPSGSRNENTAGLKGRGMELHLSYYADSGGDFSYRPALVLSTNRITVDTYPVDVELNGSVDAPGFGSTEMIRTAVGERLGDIWGPVFESVDANGAPAFKDVNGDNQLLTNPGNALDPNTDFTSLGNAFPGWELGWSNQIRYRRWELNAFVRGAFGHSLINVLRLGYEPLDAGAVNSYNRVKTDKAEAGLTQSRYSSLYVEKASFVTLDNVTLTYTLPIKPSSWLQSLQVYGTIQNAFTLTNYTGVNPEPSFIDYLAPSTFSVSRNAMSPGIDRNGGYAPARTFMIGVAAGI